MKGKKEFTKEEIEKLKELIIERNKTDKTSQKRIRSKMRKIGFYGGADWKIYNLQISHLEELISSGCIRVIEQPHKK